MDEMIFRKYELVIPQIIKELERRNIKGYYAATKEDALRQALELIPEGSTVTHGGAYSARQIGLFDVLSKGNYNYISRDTSDDKEAVYLAAFSADVYISGTNAVSEDGILVNIDGTGNRLAAIIYGPKKVIFIVGRNKIAADAENALRRARSIAAPINAQRFDVQTPCKKTGACADCTSHDTICCEFLFTRYSKENDRMHVILVNEDLGF